MVCVWLLRIPNDDRRRRRSNSNSALRVPTMSLKRKSRKSFVFSLPLILSHFQSFTFLYFFIQQSDNLNVNIEIEYVSDKVLLEADPAAAEFLRIFQKFSTPEQLTSQVSTFCNTAISWRDFPISKIIQSGFFSVRRSRQHNRLLTTPLPRLLMHRRPH
jgi:hypothetical protein